MAREKLVVDNSRLLGFRLCSAKSAKIGVKPGAKLGGKLGGKLGVKRAQ